MGAPVSAGEVHDVVFRVRFGGYDEWQVDLHLDRVERQLADLEERGGFARAGGDSRPAPMREDRFAALREEQRQGQSMPMRPVGASMPGGPMGGPPPLGAPAMAQMQGPPLPQRPLNGGPMDGPMDRPLAGQPMPGQPMPGQPMPGQPMSGPPMPGHPMSGPMDRPPLPPYQGERPFPGGPPMSQGERPFPGGPPDRTLPPGMVGPISGPPYGAPMSGPPGTPAPPLPQRPMSAPPMNQPGMGPAGGMTPPPMPQVPLPPVTAPPPYPMSQAPMSPPVGGGPGFARFDDTAYTPGGYGGFEQQGRRDYDAPPPPASRHDYEDPSRHDYEPYGHRPDDSFSGRPGDTFGGRPDDSFAGRPGMESFGGRPAMDSFAGRPDDSFAGRPDDTYGGRPDDTFGGRPGMDSFAGRPDFPMPSRHGRTDMTSEVHVPAEFNNRYTGNGAYGGGNAAYANGNGADFAYGGNGAYGGGGPVDTLNPEVARIDEMRRTFTQRRFGSGYDASQVNRLFDAIIASMSGRSGTPITDAELDPNQFSLVPGGYFEAEVEQALRQIRDLIR
jgi:DivIVA domain-containing protein